MSDTGHVSDDIDRKSFKKRLQVACLPQVNDRTKARITDTEIIRVKDPETEIQDEFQVAEVAQGMARLHLREKAREWFADEWYHSVAAGNDRSGEGDR